MDAKNELQKKSWFQRHKVWTAIIGLFLFVSIVNGISTGGKGIQTNESAKPIENKIVTESTKQPNASISANEPKENIVVPVKVSAVDLYNAYQNNSIAADEKYKDKLLEVKGAVVTIGKDILGTKFIALKTPNLVNVVQCMVKDSDSEKLTSLNKGDIVSVIGTTKGATLGNIILYDCKTI